MILSIDIGGTAVKMGLVDEGGEVHARHEASVCFDGYRTPILTTVMREAEAFLRRENVQVAGIGVSRDGAGGRSCGRCHRHERQDSRL